MDNRYKTRTSSHEPRRRHGAHDRQGPHSMRNRQDRQVTFTGASVAVQARPPVGHPRCIFLPLQLIKNAPRQHGIVFSNNGPFNYRNVNVTIKDVLPDAFDRREHPLPRVTEHRRMIKVDKMHRVSTQIPPSTDRPNVNHNVFDQVHRTRLHPSLRNHRLLHHN